MSSRHPDRTTIADVARAAGVSPTTVSHALNGRGQVDPQTRQRVAEFASRLGYRPNRHAQRLRTGEAHMIALLSSMPFAVSGGPSRLGFLMEIAAIAAAAALERGLALVLVPPIGPGQAPIDMLDVDGALLVEPTADDGQLAELIRRGITTVSIGRPGGAEASPTPWVDLQSQRTAALLLAHLRDRGARRIAMVLGSADRSAYAEARQAYEAVLVESGMPPRSLVIDETLGEEGGHVAARRLLADDPAIDAFFVPVDAFAVGVVRFLHESGRRIPDDVIVATRYDGIRARLCAPALTAVDLHLEEVARLGVDLLFEHLQGRRDRLVVTSPPARLVARESTQRQAAAPL